MVILNVEESALIIRNAVRDIPNTFHENCDKISKLERERLDLIHMAEMCDLNVVEGFKLYKEIQRVSKERRKLKDENEQLQHLVPILKKWRNRLSQLDHAVGDVRKAKSNIETRQYRCRVRKDLEKKINGC